MFLAVSGVISTVFVSAATVLGGQAATITIALWTIHSLVVAVACLARHRLAHIIEHSGHMWTKQELWFEVSADGVYLFPWCGHAEMKVDHGDHQHKVETLVLHVVLPSLLVNCFHPEKRIWFICESSWLFVPAVLH